MPVVDHGDLGLWHFDRNLTNAASPSRAAIRPLRSLEVYQGSCPE
jgi:hypothetical protein